MLPSKTVHTTFYGNLPFLWVVRDNHTISFDISVKVFPGSGVIMFIPGIVITLMHQTPQFLNTAYIFLGQIYWATEGGAPGIQLAAPFQNSVDLALDRKSIEELSVPVAAGEACSGPAENWVKLSGAWGLDCKLIYRGSVRGLPE